MKKILISLGLLASMPGLYACPMAFKNQTNAAIYVSGNNYGTISKQELDTLSGQEKKESEEYHEKMDKNFKERFNETVVMKIKPNNFQKEGFPTDADRFPSHSGDPFYVYLPEVPGSSNYHVHLTITQKTCFPPGEASAPHKVLTITKEGKLSLTKPSNFDLAPHELVESLVDAPNYKK